MGKVKNGLLLLLSAGVILLGGLLPSLAAGVREKASLGEVETAEMGPMLLFDTEEESLTNGEKLALLCGNRLSITSDYAHQTEDDVWQYAVNGLTPYLEHGFVPEDFQRYSHECHPYLCYREAEPDRRNIIWEVTLSNQYPENWLTLGVVIDDETGTVLSVSFHGEAVYEDRSLSSRVSELASVYLGGIDLITTPCSSLSGDGKAYNRCRVYDVETRVSCIAGIEFVLNTNGFSIKIYDDASWMQEP